MNKPLNACFRKVLARLSQREDSEAFNAMRIRMKRKALGLYVAPLALKSGKIPADQIVHAFK